MKFRFLLTCLALALTTPTHAQSVDMDRLVAVVNNEAITAQELNGRLNMVLRQLKQQSNDLPDTSTLKKQVLERMILENAQVQMAKDSGLEVSDSQLDATVARIASANNMNMEQFRTALEKDGLQWKAFRNNLRQEIMITQLREREVENAIAVSEGEIDNFLGNNADQNGEEVLVQHIILRLPEQASPDQIQRVLVKAQMVMDKLAKGMSFAKAAATYSDGEEALNGGAWGWRAMTRVPAAFAQALGQMRPGDISPIVRSPAGFHILRLADRRGNSALPKDVQQTHVRHILIKTNELLPATEAKQKLEGIRDRLVHGNSFAELARLYSGDLSATKGGDIGWVLPGDTVPEFQRAMDALKPGEISQVVQSPFGFHLIEVLERKVEALPAERRRAAARQVLRDRKADEAYQDWLRQLRDRTYVEYHLEDK